MYHDPQRRRMGLVQLILLLGMIVMSWFICGVSLLGYINVTPPTVTIPQITLPEQSPKSSPQTNPESKPISVAPTEQAPPQISTDSPYIKRVLGELQEFQTGQDSGEIFDLTAEQIHAKVRKNYMEPLFIERDEAVYKASLRKPAQLCQKMSGEIPSISIVVVDTGLDRNNTWVCQDNKLLVNVTSKTGPQVADAEYSWSPNGTFFLNVQPEPFTSTYTGNKDFTSQVYAGIYQKNPRGGFGQILLGKEGKGAFIMHDIWISGSYYSHGCISVPNIKRFLTHSSILIVESSSPSKSK